MTAPTTSTASPWAQRWQQFSVVSLRAFHRYANWLVSITWRKFVVLAVLLLIGSAILQSLPPFSWRVTETFEDDVERPRKAAKAPKAPKAPKATTEPIVKIEKATPSGNEPEGVNISIDERGIRITPRAKGAASAASAAASSASGALMADDEKVEIHLSLPPGADKETVREVVREAIGDARGAIHDALQAKRDAAEAARDAADAVRDVGRSTSRTRRIHWGDFLTELAFLWILGSAIIKATYKGRVQAEVKAAQATETAEAESLKRQVVEARMAAMQAQVEPHFLFNTLASIDHLIETDPARASLMQKNLIALLRASMPTMREASDGGVRDLGRELAVIRPYLAILKVRMEERLSTTIDVPDGLLSAEFPPMMIQTLVENAIKHGLEPKPEGGSLKVRAEIVHGKLAVSVADTGLGFGRAATAGTGVGLANIRERLQLLFGARAALTIAENAPSGTLVTVTVPYKTIEGVAA